MKWSQKDLSNQEEPPSRRQGSPALLRNLSSETEVPSTSKASVSGAIWEKGLEGGRDPSRLMWDTQAVDVCPVLTLGCAECRPPVCLQ